MDLQATAAKFLQYFSLLLITAHCCASVACAHMHRAKVEEEELTQKLFEQAMAEAAAAEVGAPETLNGAGRSCGLQCV